MKKVKYLLGASILFLLAGCAEGDTSPSDWNESPYDASSRGESASGDYYVPKTSPSETDTSNKDYNQNEQPGYNLPREGQLTCSAINDNNDYNYWKELCSSNSDIGRSYDGFSGYVRDYDFYTANRLELNVINGNNVKVTIKDTQYQTYADNFHKAYLFPKEIRNNYDVEINYTDSNNQEQTLIKNVKDGDIVDLAQTFTTSKNLQIMFVIDATGSMGDELRYLQAEIDSIITRVKDDNETANIELAIMMYRDTTDEYLIRYSDFSTDISAQKAFLAEQRAAQGGDFPEAVEEAMNVAMEKQWNENATKMIVHVADAPAHKRDVPRWNNAVCDAASKGIKIISVGCSGIDKDCEYMFRSQSIITGGQYVFLTDDSHIGGSHLEATTEHSVPVEYLNSCLTRLINGYFKGVMTSPTPYYQDTRA